MTLRGPDEIVLAPGHAITRSGRRAKEKALDGIPMCDVLRKAEAVYASSNKIIGELDKGFFGTAAISMRYHGLVAQKNWPAVDKLVLDTLAATSSDYNAFLDAEEWMQAFSGRLCVEAETACTAYRWLDPPELKSYLGGTFESRAEGAQSRRGFKALSMNPNLNFELRRVALEVPLDHGMRKSIRCVRYTVLPREVEGPDERISDPKNALYAREAEVRVPDGTAVPSGAVFTIKQGTRVDQNVVMALEKNHAVVR